MLLVSCCFWCFSLFSSFLSFRLRIILWFVCLRDLLFMQRRQQHKTAAEKTIDEFKREFDAVDSYEMAFEDV